MTVNKIKTFISLCELFEQNGFNLYLVGGSTRDYLLGKELTDMDVTTNATPNEIKVFLKGGDYTYEKYGSVKVKFQEVKFDITTLRKESKYKDSRHPEEIEFTNKLKEDVKRRDLTVNALYLDKELNVIDLVNGQEDLKNKILRFIGDPKTRIVEDPLRIIRILRFSLDLGFEIENTSKNAIFSKINLINKLNPSKVDSEINKCSNKINLFNLLKVIK